LGDVFTECVQGCIGKRNLCIGCFRHYVMNGLLYRLPPTFNMDVFLRRCFIPGAIVFSFCCVCLGVFTISHGARE
jgi:hypothetical protein